VRRHLLAVMLGVMPAGVLAMLPRVARMTGGGTRVMPGLLMVSTFMMRGGFTVMPRRMLVMVSSAPMMRRAFMLSHCLLLRWC
jgi:hypothetical protein